MMKILLALILVALVAGCTCPTCGILDEWECKSQGGDWGYVGLSPDPMCNIRTSDGGEECSSSVDCESSCIAELTQEQDDLLMQGIPIETTGRCSTHGLTVGCMAFVEDGRVENIICVD